MISYLNGDVLEILEESIWLNVHDVGYEIMIHPNTIPKIFPQSRLEVFCHTMVSENDIKLYGFLNKEELLLFRRLMTVSGVGGKVAQAMVATLDPSTLVQAVLSEDEKTLTKIPGVGKKMASRLIFELKEKLQKDTIPIAPTKSKETTVNSTAAMLSDVMEALEALGYTRTEIYPHLVSLQEEGALLERTEDNIRLVLKRISSSKFRK